MRRTNIVVCTISLICLFGAVCDQLIAAEPASTSRRSAESRWTGFLTGTANPDVDAEKLPLTWTPDSVTWKSPLRGDGQSSPVVWNDAVFVTSVEGPNKETYVVTRFGLTDGKPAWSFSLTSTDPVPNTYLVSRAAPTPVCDASNVFAFFESGDVVALTHEGNEVWKRSLSRDFGKFDNKFGLAASPVQDENSIYILIDHAGPSYLVALSKRDGQTLWKSSRESRRSWSSPYLASIDGQPQIVCSSLGSVDGYDPASGRQLWTYTQVGGNSAATPVVFGQNSVLLGSLIRPSEGPAEHADRTNLFGEILRKNDGWEFKPNWIAEKARGSFSSPVGHDGRAYWINSAGVISCLDLQSGRELYTKRLPCGQCWATPIAVGSRLYVFGKDGATTVLQSGSEYVELAESNRLWAASEPAQQKEEPASVAQEKDANRRRAMANASGPIQYAAVVVPRAFLIRSGNELFCVRSRTNAVQ